MIILSNEAVDIVRSFVEGFIGGLGSLKGSIALAGLVMVVIVAVAYGIYGGYKFVKFTLRLRPHEFALIFLAVGLALIVISILIP